MFVTVSFEIGIWTYKVVVGAAYRLSGARAALRNADDGDWGAVD
jgi:hypothetical protein